MPEGLNLRLLDVLGAAADALVDELDADACAISRVIGDVLILVTERVHDGSTLQSGQGYLVPDYPQTARGARDAACRARSHSTTPTSTRARPRSCAGSATDRCVMLPLEINGDVWGLVEVYRTDRRPFTAADVKRARRALPRSPDDDVGRAAVDERRAAGRRRRAAAGARRRSRSPASSSSPSDAAPSSAPIASSASTVSTSRRPA